MILMERGLHSPVTAGKRLADAPGNSVLEALENSQHGGRLSPRITSASLHGNHGDIPGKGKFEIDSLFGTHHGSENSSSAEISSSESRKKMSHYSEVSQESDVNSDVEVGCPSHRSPSQHKENNKGTHLILLRFIRFVLLYSNAADYNIIIILIAILSLSQLKTEIKLNNNYHHFYTTTDSNHLKLNYFSVVIIPARQQLLLLLPLLLLLLLLLLDNNVITTIIIIICRQIIIIATTTIIVRQNYYEYKC